MAARFDAIVAGVFVRASSGSGRLDLAAPVVRLLQDLARASARRGQPMVTVFFGNPYVPLSVPELPAMLETYDFSDYAELSAVRAMAGEIPIGGQAPDLVARAVSPGTRVDAAGLDDDGRASRFAHRRGARLRFAGLRVRRWCGCRWRAVRPPWCNAPDRVVV